MSSRPNPSHQLSIDPAAEPLYQTLPQRTQGRILTRAAQLAAGGTRDQLAQFYVGDCHVTVRVDPEAHAAHVERLARVRLLG